MSVLSVHALNEDALTVDEQLFVADCYSLEAVLCRERHFLGATSVLLAYQYGVEVRIFGAPSMQAAEVAEVDVLSLG